MLLLCDSSVILPFRIIFNNILSTAIYPDIWKLANVTPVCGKIFDKIIFNTIFTLTLLHKTLSPKTNLDFDDSTTNQLIDLVNEIHHAFDSTKVRAIFLDISKAFDKGWHDGLIFKTRQNGVSGRLLKLFQSYLNNRKQRRGFQLNNLL